MRKLIIMACLLPLAIGIQLGCSKEDADEENEVSNAIYVDLGLQSGTKWCAENEEGFYDFETAMEKFGTNMPTKAQIEELQNTCNWNWTEIDGVNGYTVTGPNGNSIFLPAIGVVDFDGNLRAGNLGAIWSCELKGPNQGHCLAFDSFTWRGESSYGFAWSLSVCLVKK